MIKMLNFMLFMLYSQLNIFKSLLSLVSDPPKDNVSLVPRTLTQLGWSKRLSRVLGFPSLLSKIKPNFPDVLVRSLDYYLQLEGMQKYNPFL